MKKLLLASLSMLSISAFASTPQLTNLSKTDVQKVGNEFAVNFAHTAVAAPETDGLWGVEVGVIGGSTASPNLKKVVDSSGGNGKDFKTIYHAGIMARVHLPLDFFLEGSVLPQRAISGVKINSNSAGIGWNVGRFAGLPLDLAIGANSSRGNVSFKQDATTNVPVDSTISVKTKTTNLWVGISKTFLFFTPYAKVGSAHTQADVKVDASSGTIFNYTSKQKESVDKRGGYVALGLNLQLAFIKLGFEVSQMNTVKSATGKLSLDF
jgi:hypothetical protein